MSDAGDRTKVQDNADSQISDINTLSIGRLAVPAALATQRTMLAFPTLDVDQKPLDTLFLSREPLTKAERQGLRALFKGTKSKRASAAKA